MFTFPILFMKGLVGKWMWTDGLGMKQNRTNGLGFLLVGCFDLAPLHSLYSYVFCFFCYLFYAAELSIIYQDCFLLYPYTAMTCHSGDSFDYEDI